MSKCTEFYVYEHWRMDQNVCFYVGKGCGDRAYRLIRKNSHHRAIVNKCSISGIEIRMTHIGLTEKEALKIEIERIAYWKSLGAKLANKTIGGEGTSGFKFSAESVERMSIAKMGRPGLKTMLGKKHSVKSRSKISAALKGRVLSAESIEKSAAKRRGMPSPIKGIKRSPEFGAKISAAKKGIQFSEEHKLKLSIARRNRPFPSEETREKLSLAAKRRWEKHQYSVGGPN